MRLIFAAVVAALVSVPPAYANRVRDGFGTSTRCHCDRYLVPHATERARPAAGRGAYRGTTHRRY